MSAASPTRWSTAAPASSASAPTTSTSPDCGKRPSKRPGETPDCDLTEARQFNLMFETKVGPVEESGSKVYLRPGDRAGDLHQLQERRPARPPQAAVRHRAGRQVVPERDHARQLHLPHARVRADGDGVLRAAGRGGASGTATGSTSARAWHRRFGLRESHLRVRAHDADELSHYSTGTSDIEYLFPIGWSELEGDRQPWRLRPHGSTREHSGTKLEWVDAATGERYVPHVIEPALGVNRSMLAFLVDAYDEEEVAGRERTVLRLHPQIAPVKAAVLPLIGKDSAMVERARGLFEELRRVASVEYDDSGADRPPLPAPGRDRHAVRAHDRRADARGRHGHDPRPRLARPGAHLDRRGRASTCSTASPRPGRRRRPRRARELHRAAGSFVEPCTAPRSCSRRAAARRRRPRLEALRDDPVVGLSPAQAQLARPLARG